jgi:hypothetical protein
MIIKLMRTDGHGWVLRDNIGKVNYNTNDYEVRLFRKSPDSEEEPQLFVKSEKVASDISSSIDIWEIDLETIRQGNNNCKMILGTMNYRKGGDEHELFIVTNMPCYILNDSGKTIETI